MRKIFYCVYKIFPQLSMHIISIQKPEPLYLFLLFFLFLVIKFLSLIFSPSRHYFFPLYLFKFLESIKSKWKIRYMVHTVCHSYFFRLVDFIRSIFTSSSMNFSHSLCVKSNNERWRRIENRKHYYHYSI